MAGETAAIMVPMRAASRMVMPSSGGAMSIIPVISRVAGMMDMSIAGRPTLRRSLMSSASPARIRMIIRAICLSSAEMPSSVGESALSA